MNVTDLQNTLARTERELDEANGVIDWLEANCLSRDWPTGDTLVVKIAIKAGAPFPHRPTIRQAAIAAMAKRHNAEPSEQPGGKDYTRPADSLRRIVGWTNGRAISSRYRGTPRFPLIIYRTKAEARREFGLDAVRVEVIPANDPISPTPP